MSHTPYTRNFRKCWKSYKNRSEQSDIDSLASGNPRGYPSERSDTKRSAYPSAPAEVSHYNYFYTLTINPDYNNMPSRMQYKKTLNCVQKLITEYFKDFRFAVELTPKNGHIHYHGIGFTPVPENMDTDIVRLIFLDKAKGCKPLGFVQIETIRNVDATYSYITKDLVKTDAVLNCDKQRTKLQVYFKSENKEDKVIKVGTRLKDIVKVIKEIPRKPKVKEVAHNNLNTIRYSLSDIITGPDLLDEIEDLLKDIDQLRPLNKNHFTDV